MGSDYKDAIWLPCKNFWPGGNSMARIVIHGTASGAQQSAYQLATSSEFNDGSTASSHYINDRDGTVYQIVPETDAAWGNCCVTGTEAPVGVYPTPGKGDYHLHGLDPSHNYNHDTISIENIKYSTDNSEPLAPAQYNSLVKLVTDICKRRHITPTRDTLIGHYDLDPVNRARCPGTFDWEAFRYDVAKGAGMLSSTGEIADFLDADQFQPAKTQGACGFFAAAICDAAAPVGTPPTKSAAQVIAEAEAWYAQYDGDNSINNFKGMVQSQLHQLLDQIGLKHQDTPVTVDAVRSSVRAGTPVIICSVEDSYYDMALGDKVPYYWNGSGFNHIITVTGIASDGNFIVRDPANVTDLNNPNSLRPGPRTYDASKVQLLWATAVTLRQGGAAVGIVPAGWTDDGKNLHNPVNSFVVAAGFRQLVLNWPGGWESWNVPLENEHDVNPMEESNPGLGDGHCQVFRNRRLEYQVSTQKMFEGWLGQEFLWYVQKVASLQAQVTSLQAQLQAAGVSADEQAAINAAVAALTALAKFKK